MVGILEALGHQDDGVFRERHFQDRGGIRLQQQVDAIQLQLHGAAGGQEHHGGGRIAGGPCRLFQAGWRRGLLELALLGRAGSLWLRCPAGRGVCAGAARLHVQHVDCAVGLSRRRVQGGQWRWCWQSGCSHWPWSPALYYVLPDTPWTSIKSQVLDRKVKS